VPNLLLEAARQTGNSSIAQDIEGIAAAPVPVMPTPEELAEAAVLATAAAIQQASAAASMSSGDEWEQELAAAGGVAGRRATSLPVQQLSSHVSRPGWDRWHHHPSLLKTSKLM